MLIGWEAVYLLLVKFVVFINISSYLLASVHVNGRLHTRVWWREYARMFANKRTEIQLQIQEGTSINIAVVESVVTPPFRSEYITLYCPFGDSFGKLKLPSSQPTLISRWPP